LALVLDASDGSLLGPVDGSVDGVAFSGEHFTVLGLGLEGEEAGSELLLGQVSELVKAKLDGLDASKVVKVVLVDELEVAAEDSETVVLLGFLVRSAEILAPLVELELLLEEQDVFGSQAVVHEASGGGQDGQAEGKKKLLFHFN
jgi:hypothetical protein